MAQADERSEHLFNEIKSGSVEAFDQFYEIHAAFVYRIALKMTKSQCEAEDLCHDVFVEVFHHPEQFDSSRGSVQAWLAIKTKSRFIDRMRKKKNVVVGFERKDNTPNHEPTTEELVSLKLEREGLVSALNHLPAPQRKAVLKKYFEYQTQNEIAEVMRKPIGTVKSLIRYGLKNLRNQLTKNGLGESGGDHHNY